MQRYRARRFGRWAGRLAAVGGLGWALAGCRTPTPLGVALRRAEDSAVLTPSRGVVRVVVESPRGIGGARVRRTGRSWPDRMVLVLRLKGLESLALRNRRLHLATSLGRPARTPYWTTGRDENRGDAPDGYLDLPIARLGPGIEVVIPPEFRASDADEFQVEWIDFYRN